MSDLPLYDVTSFVDVLHHHAMTRPDALAYRFLLEGEVDGPCETWTYEQLYQQARTIAGYLQQAGFQGERALLLFPSSLSYIGAFLGCLCAGVVAVPVPAPDPTRRERSLARIQSILQNASPRVVLTQESLVPLVEPVLEQISSEFPLSCIATDVLPESWSTRWQQPSLDPKQLAFLQYTSGSTRAPRGVMVSHENLLANAENLRISFDFTEHSSLVGWVPFYHDLGLSGNILQPLYMGNPCTLMSPIHFLQRPMRWLEAISRYRIYISGAPNFAYNLCVRRCEPEAMARLDLSCWEVAVNSSEPIRPEDLAAFVKVFAACGFSAKAFSPSYGLAESTLLTTSVRTNVNYQVLDFSQEQLKKNKVVLIENQEASEEKVFSLVSCGVPVPLLEIQIVDPKTHSVCDPGQVGEIWVTGSAVSTGYWQDPEATQETFPATLADTGEGPYLRTGDLGFLHQGELFVVGRLKELIIIRGRNHYPQDIEYTIEQCHEAFRPGGSIAFPLEVGGQEGIGVVVEVRDQTPQQDWSALLQTIRQAVSQEHELSLDAIVLVPPRTIPKTTSGKRQRSLCKKLYLSEQLNVLASDVRMLADRQMALSEHWANQLIEVSLPSLSEACTWSQDRRFACLKSFFLALLSRLSKRSFEHVNLSHSLAELGLDSLQRVELLFALEQELGVALPPTLLNPAASLQEVVTLLEQQWHPAEKLKASDDSSGASVLPDFLPGDVVPLTPMQRSFLAWDFQHPERYVNIAYLRTPASLDIDVLRRALKSLEHLYDCWHLRFHQEATGWVQRYTRPGQSIGFRIIDVNRQHIKDIQAFSKELQEEIMQHFDVAKGPLAEAIVLDRGAGHTGMLIFAVHHLISDMLSMILMVTALERSYRDIMAGRSASSQRPLTFRKWATALEEYATSSQFLAELPFWQQQADQAKAAQKPVIPTTDVTDAVLANEATLLKLSVEETERFLRRFPSAQQQHDVCLTALAWAWRVCTRQEQFQVMLHHHGRQPLPGDLSPVHTAGDITYSYPVFLRCAGGYEPDTLWQHVSQTVAEVPAHGRGYGWIHTEHPHPKVRALAQTLPPPLLSMTYRGYLDDVFRSNALFPAVGSTTLMRFQEADDFSLDGALYWMIAKIRRGQLQWVIASQETSSATKHFLAQLNAEATGCLRSLLDSL